MNLEWQKDIIEQMIREKQDTTISEYFQLLKELKEIENSLSKPNPGQEPAKDDNKIKQQHAAT
jgi:hypothetical protein